MLVKVAHLFPVADKPETGFFMSFMALQEWRTKNLPDVRFDAHLVHGARIDEAREELAAMALGSYADWLFWLDDDHTFPPDALGRLLAHNLPIVGCNARKRRYPDKIESSARRFVNGRLKGLEPKKEGIEPVDLLGFGVTLVSAEVFRKMPRPWFKWGPHGEDGYFCEQAIKAGFTPHVDHALSREVGHIAETVLRF
jgi:hypothetical protein